MPRKNSSNKNHSVSLTNGMKKNICLLEFLQNKDLSLCHLDPDVFIGREISHNSKDFSPTKRVRNDKFIILQKLYLISIAFLTCEKVCFEFIPIAFMLIK